MVPPGFVDITSGLISFSTPASGWHGPYKADVVTRVFENLGSLQGVQGLGV